MKNVFKAIWLFYIFKFAPKTIEPSNRFWFKNVKMLNSMRKDTFYLCKVLGIYIREPYAHPMENIFYFSRLHPFCWKK